MKKSLTRLMMGALVFMMFGLVGCGSGGGGASTEINTYDISGTVTSSGTPLQGVTINLGDWSKKFITSAITDGSGNYTLSNLSNGIYTVTPSKLGYSFYPYVYTTTLSNAGKIDYFTCVPITYSVSGKIVAYYDYNHPTAIANRSMTITNKYDPSMVFNTSTDSTGYYNVSGVPSGEYIITNPNYTSYCTTGCDKYLYATVITADVSVGSALFL